MRRREFIAILGGEAGWPIAGHAEHSERTQSVSVLTPAPEDIARAVVGSLAKSLESLGWVEGKNIRIDLRFAAGDLSLLETSAAPQRLLTAYP